MATGPSYVKTEILDISDPSKSCVLEDIPNQYASAGGLIGTTPVICGGYSSGRLNECLLIGTSQVFVTMNYKRNGHSSVAINDDLIWITGGWDESNRLDSSEFISSDGAVNGPTLPKAVNGHCTVKFPDDGLVYLIGGYFSFGGCGYPACTTNNVWIANPSNGYSFVQGPSMITARTIDQGCATMSIGAKSIIVTANEILDPLSNQWVAGK